MQAVKLCTACLLCFSHPGVHLHFRLGACVLALLSAWDTLLALPLLTSGLCSLSCVHSVRLQPPRMKQSLRPLPRCTHPLYPVLVFPKHASMSEIPEVCFLSAHKDEDFICLVHCTPKA